MPVFHTKTIESILDPVAQQVNPFLVKMLSNSLFSDRKNQMASKFQLEFLCLCILDPVAQQVHKSIQKLHCRVVNVIIFSSSYHVLFVSCFLSIFLNIDLANLMCMGSYMTDYIKISTNLHDCNIFFPTTKIDDSCTQVSIMQKQLCMYGSIFLSTFSMNYALSKLE